MMEKRNFKLNTQPNKLEIIRGGNLSPTEQALGIVTVNRWLRNGVPNTKPRLASELIAGLEGSFYAYLDNRLIGHVALKNTVAVELSMADGRQFAADIGEAAHFRIESLIANVKGRGIGTLLVDRALDSIPDRLTELGLSSSGLVVVTAIAAPSSQGVFANAGFSSYQDLGIMPASLPADFDLSSGKQFMVHTAPVLQPA